MKLVRVRLKQHDEPVDLTGIDTLTLGGCSRQEAEKRLGLELKAHSMKDVTLLADKATSMTGKVAEELHIWPKAHLGRSFKKLTIQIASNEITCVVWGFELEHFLPKSQKQTPWYKRIFS
jgi:hypothetical protein